MSQVMELYPSGSFRDEVASRLRQGIAARNIKKSDVADIIGMNQSSFSKRVNARLAIDMDEADRISAAIGIRRDWLLTGQEPMLDPEWVPPAGIEPAAFCSGDPMDHLSPSATEAFPLADVLPFPAGRGRKTLEPVTNVPDRAETNPSTIGHLVRIWS